MQFAHVKVAQVAQVLLCGINSLDPSSTLTALLLFKVSVMLEPVFTVTGLEAGYSVDRSLVCHIETDRFRQAFTLTSELPINQTQKKLVCQGQTWGEPRHLRAVRGQC